MQPYFGERAEAACYVYVAYVRNAVAAIFSLILLLRKIANRESSIPWNRSLRAKTEDGVSGGLNSRLFFIIQHGVMRAERHYNAHSKENAYNTLGTLDYRFFYLYRYFTENARYSESPRSTLGATYVPLKPPFLKWGYDRRNGHDCDSSNCKLTRNNYGTFKEDMIVAVVIAILGNWRRTVSLKTPSAITWL